LKDIKGKFSLHLSTMSWRHIGGWV